jgi:transposase
MRVLKFELKLQQKGYYTDGHNRIDVTAYRDNTFLPRMVDLERRMREYSGPDMTDIKEPALRQGERRVVVITHDESTFYCCEGKPMLWMENGKNKLLPKTKGTSIMVSGFICDCHGFFYDTTACSFSTFEAGKNREGWFTNTHLVKQFDDLIPLIKELHPHCDIVIGFDNSMTHHAKVPNGLDVSKLKMGDGRAAGSDVDMKAGWFLNSDGERIEQSMQFPDGVQKGAKTILRERGKSKNDQGHELNIQCQHCRKNTTDDDRAAGVAGGLINPKCCASYVLSHEPDFVEQEEWLTQAVHDAGFDIIFYPKYHCELNYIEMVWGWTKSHHRRNCTYNYKDLKENLPITLRDLLPIAFVRRFSQHCLRFMSGYRQNLEGPLLDYVMRKYTSHRTIPLLVMAELTKEYDKYVLFKQEKKHHK